MSSLHDPEPLRAGKASAYVETLTPHLYIPTAQRPVRAKCRWLEADTQVKPHRHPWGQLAISTTGTIRLTVAQGTYIVPPSRVLWVPPGMEHAVTMVESADLRTLYFFQTQGRCGPDVPPAKRRPGASAGCSMPRICCAPWCASCPRCPMTASSCASRTGHASTI